MGAAITKCFSILASLCKLLFQSGADGRPSPRQQQPYIRQDPQPTPEPPRRTEEVYDLGPPCARPVGRVRNAPPPAPRRSSAELRSQAAAAHEEMGIAFNVRQCLGFVLASVRPRLNFCYRSRKAHGVRAMGRSPKHGATRENSLRSANRQKLHFSIFILRLEDTGSSGLL